MYSISIGGFLTGLAAFGTNQAVIQRALGTSSKARAQWSYVMSGPLLLLTQFVAVVVGWVLFAYYATTCCDPIKNVDEVDRPDKVLPYFIMEVIDYPTVPGFFFGAVISGSLSTISSSVNSVSAVIWDDVLSNCLGKIPEMAQSVVRKFVSVLFGCLVIGAAFLLEEYKTNSTLVGIVFSVFGALQGPVMAMFMFAAFIPFPSGFGTLAGGICALAVTLWMTVGRTDLGVSFQVYPLPDGGCGISNTTCSLDESLLPGSPDVDWFGDLDWFYSISFWFYPLISLIIVFIVGTVVSVILLCICKTQTKAKKMHLFHVVRCCVPGDGQKDVETDKQAVKETDDEKEQQAVTEVEDEKRSVSEKSSKHSEEGSGGAASDSGNEDQ